MTDTETERNLIKEIIDNKDETGLKLGQTYCLISASWFFSWQRYVQYNSTFNILSEPRPGPINNSELLDDFGDLKAEVAEVYHFVVIPKPAWNLLHSWYQGGPLIERLCVSSRGKPVVEYRKLRIGVIWSAHPETVVVRRFSKSTTAEQFLDEMGKEMKWNPKRIRLIDFYQARRMNINSRDRWNKSLEEAQIVDKQYLLIEEMDEDGSWPNEHIYANLKKKSFPNPFLNHVPGTDGPTDVNIKNHDSENLLETAKFSDIQICGVRLHKAILETRAPGCISFLLENQQKIPKDVIDLFIEYVYTDRLKEIPTNQVLCGLLKLSKDTGFSSLESLCQKLLMDGLTKRIAFETLSFCVDNNFTQEIDWIIWFIGKNKPAPTTEWLVKMASSNPIILTKAISELASPVHQKPNLNELITRNQNGILNDFENLLTSGIYSDFTLKLYSTKFHLHSCILYKWKFFSILKHSNIHQPQTEIPIDTFRKILRFVYCGKTDGLTLTDATWVLSMKEYYLLENDSQLVKTCEEIISQLSSKDWIEGYQLALVLGEASLLEKSKDVSVAVEPRQVMKILDKKNAENMSLRAQIKSLENQIRTMKESKTK